MVEIGALWMEYMVAIPDASYIFQPILVKGNILAYFSFVLKLSYKESMPLKAVVFDSNDSV